jgi:oligopeptide transport system substrate-binding protein
MLAKLGVAAPDPKTFIVTLAKPATYFLSIVALWITVPVQEKWITSPNATEAANYVSSGPYILEKWSHANQIVLKPNPNWYGEQKSILTQINMTMTVEPAQSQAAYEAGELAMNVTPAADILRVKADPVLGPESRDIPNVTLDYYDYNNGVDPKGLGTLARCADPKACPTMNKNFRIALTRAIDKKALLDATWAGLGQIANSFIQPGIPGHDKDLDPYPYDLTKAKEALALALTELGIPDVASLPKLKFGYNTGSDHENRVAFLAEAWRTNLGVQTEQIGTDFSLLLTQRTAGVYDISRDAWGADFPHASNQLGNFVCGGGNNNNNWCNKDFDALLDQAATEADQAKQEDLYKQAQKLLIDDAAIIPFRYRVTAYEIKPYLGGLNVTPTDAWLPGDLFYETMYIKKQ